MAADFNLSAAISLQLATGAIGRLRDDIQKGFTAPLEVDSKDVKRKIGAVKKDLASDPIKVPITFINKSAKDQYADIKKGIKPFPIDVYFNEKSVNKELTSNKLKSLLTNKKIFVPIDVEFSTGTKAALADIQKRTEALLKAQAAFDKAKKTKAPPTPFVKPKRTVTDSAENISDLIQQTGELNNLNKQLFKKQSGAYGGGFFDFANTQLKKIETQIKHILALDPKLRAKFGDAKNALQQKFAGLNDDSTGNAVASLRALYSAYSELDNQQKNLAKNQKKYGNTFNIQSQIDQIDEAKKAIASMFLSYDSADPGSFKTGLNTQLKETRQLTIDATREMRAFSSLISNLNQKKAGITAADGGAKTQKNIDAVIARAQSLQASGSSTDQIRADAIFQQLSAVARVLDYVDIAAQRAGSSIGAAVSKVNKGELKNTFGGRTVGLSKNVNRIGASGEAKAALATLPKEVAKIQSETNQDINGLVQKAGDVQKQFQRLRGEWIKLQEANFDGPAKSLRSFAGEVYRLVQAGASIDNIDVAVSKKLAEVANVVGLEKKVNTAINQIERLKHALEFSPVTDNAGAKKTLDKLEADVKARAGKFKDLTPDKLTQGVSAGLFDVRALQRFNDAADATSQKLRNIGDANENLAVGKIYTRNADEFDKAAEKIANGAGTIGQKLQALKRKSDEVLIHSKFDAEGGFFGAIAKSAGLATKRLAAFLFMAQGLYTVQALLSASLQEAIKIDREFIKLEQVFNKDFSGTNLEKSLTNVKKQIFDLGKDLGVAATGVADAAQILAQAGVAGKDLEIILATVAKSELGPSFGKAAETAEAAIAIFRQFNLTAKETEEALGGINRISAKYAVEAKGITEAVRRAGGIFSSSGDDIGQFAAAFTLIKQQTREADEAIATGLRNVAQRLQSSTVQKKLREALGINLVENGEFVGFEASITRIGQALKDLPNGLGGEKSPMFAQIREIIGGARQGGRITPLLQDFAKFGELTDEFRKGAKSIDEDVKTAFKSIENKIQRAKTAVTDLFHEIISSDLAKFLVEGFVQITTFATNMLKVLNSVPGAILAIGTAAQILGKSGFVAKAVIANFAPRSTFLHKNKGGAIGLNLGGDGSGGLIPGRGPNKDSLLAYLTKGEYVIKRGSVDQYGKGFLDSINDGTLPANSGGMIRRNIGGIIPGFNKGGLTGSSGTSSLFNGFVGFIKKVIGLGGAVEKTAQEIQTGLNLPELFDRAIKSRSSSIDIDIASLLKDKAKTNIDTIRKSGPFVDTSGDKFLPKPGTPELPSNIMDGIIKDALKSPAAKATPSLNYKGNSEQLRNLSKEAGIDIPENLFKQLFKGVQIVDQSELKEGSTASFNRSTKQAKFTSSSVFNPKLVAHEIGHGLEVAITGKLKGIVGALQKGGVGDRTRARISKSGKAGLYGEEGSAKFNKKFNSESIADIFAEAAAVKSGKGSEVSDADKKLLDLFTTTLNKQTGISITGRSKNNDTAIGLSGGLDNIKQTDTERALGSGVRLPGSLNKPLNSVSQKIIDNRNNAEIKGGSSSSNFQSIIQKIREQGAFKSGGGGGNPPNSPRGGNFPTFNKIGSKVSNAVSSKVGNIGNIGSVLPTKKAILGFGKDLVSTKGGIISLVTGFAVLQGVLGQFSEGLTGLVTAMAAAAFSMYTISSLGGQIAGVAGKIGTAGKGIIAGKGKVLAKEFGQSAAGKAKAARSAAVKAIPSVRDPFGMKGLIGSGPKVDAAGKVLSTKDILASIKSKAPLDATKKAALAASNSAAKSTASKAAQVSAQSGVGGTLAKGAGVAKSAAGLAKGLNYAAIAVGLVTGALGYFADSAEKSADLAIENATTLKEAQEGGSKKRLASVSKKAVSGAGTIATGALTGATIGSFVPVIGTAIGALVGGLAAALYTFSGSIGKMLGGLAKSILPKFVVDFGSGIASFASGLASGVSDFTSDMMTGISDAAYVLSENLKGGSLLDITGLSGGNSAGAKRLAVAKDQDNRDFRLKKVKEGLEEQKTKKIPQAKLEKNTIDDLLVQGLGAKAAVVNAKKSKYDDKSGTIKKGEFKDLAVEEQDAIRKDLQSIADVFNSSSAENQKLISDNFAANGEDMTSLFTDVGVVLEKTKATAAAAFNKLNIFFSEMGKNVEFASARISGLDAGLDFASDPSASGQAFAPSQLLDIIGSGIDPKTLGLGKTFDQSLANTDSLTRSFDPKLAAAAEFDIKGRRAARSTSDAITKAAPNISLKSTDTPAIQSFLEESFKTASGGNKDLEARFGEYLDTQEDLGKVIGSDGKVNVLEINSLFKEFGELFSSGALEEMKKLGETARKYSDQYKQSLAERFALEGEVITLLQSNIGKRKGINDTINQAAGLTGDKLAEAEGRQAAQSTFETKANTLTGTGLGGNATVAEMSAALLASQQRQRDARKTATDQILPGAGSDADIITKTAEIEAVEAERQKRLKDGLTYVAGGTDTAAHAMAEFARASEKAATSAKNLTGSLLGTDDEMMKTMLGVQALHKINAAYAQGGTKAGMAALSTMSEDQRQAVEQRISSNPELQAQFNQSTGIGSNISAGPEAGAAIGAQKEQMAANQGLVAGLTDLGNVMKINTDNLQKIFESQFKNAQTIIQEAENTAKNLVTQIAALPEVIKHEGNFNINIVGAEIFKSIDPAITKIVDAKIKAHFDDFGHKLAQNNVGLNAP